MDATNSSTNELSQFQSDLNSLEWKARWFLRQLDLLNQHHATYFVEYEEEVDVCVAAQKEYIPMILCENAMKRAEVALFQANEKKREMISEWFDMITSIVNGHVEELRRSIEELELEITVLQTPAEREVLEKAVVSSSVTEVSCSSQSKLSHISPMCISRGVYGTLRPKYEEDLVRLRESDPARYHQQLVVLIRVLDNEITQQQRLHEQCVIQLNAQADSLIGRRLPEMETLNRERDQLAFNLMEINRSMAGSTSQKSHLDGLRFRFHCATEQFKILQRKRVGMRETVKCLKQKSRKYLEEGFRAWMQPYPCNVGGVEQLGSVFSRMTMEENDLEAREAWQATLN